MQKDIVVIEGICEDAEPEMDEDNDVMAKFNEGGKKAIDSITGFFGKKNTKPEPVPEDDVFETIKKLSALKDIGAITQEEFEAKKTELLAKL